MIVPDWGFVSIVMIGLTVSGLIKGLTGIGYASCALPFLVFAIGLKEAIVVALVPAMATNIALAVSIGNPGHLLKKFAVLYLMMLPGIAVGAWGLLILDSGNASVALGVIIIAYALFALIGPNLSLSGSNVTNLQSPVGLISGFIAGLTGSQVFPFIPFLLASNLAPALLAQAINLGVTISSFVVLVSMLALRTTSIHMMLLSTLAIPPAIAGVWLGTRLRPHVSDQIFRVVLLIVLAFLGIGMIARQLLQ